MVLPRRLSESLSYYHSTLTGSRSAATFPVLQTDAMRYENSGDRQDICSTSPGRCSGARHVSWSACQRALAMAGVSCASMPRADTRRGERPAQGAAVLPWRPLEAKGKRKPLQPMFVREIARVPPLTKREIAKSFQALLGDFDAAGHESMSCTSQFQPVLCPSVSSQAGVRCPKRRPRRRIRPLR